MFDKHAENGEMLDGKVCLVTGASRGIGAAVAEDLANKGARIAVHYGSSRDRAEEVLARLSGDGHRLFATDLSEPSSAPALVEQVVVQFGRIDVLVNNAGVYRHHGPLDVQEDQWYSEWQNTLAINLLSPANLCHAAARAMRTQGGGRIINVGSRGAFRGEPDAPAYGASKAGLHAMSQSLAVALAPIGVLVFAVAPGFVATEMAQAFLDAPEGEAIRAQSPFGRVAHAAEVAATITYLAGEAPQFMSGGIIDVNGASYLRS